MNKKMFLKENTIFAPYISNWYAWSALIPPHMAGANICERHIKIMESFIESPELHYEAINTRGMIGGPFINLPIASSEAIKTLLNQTKVQNANLINLHNDIKSFDIYLQKNAVGHSLEAHYQALPESLKGVVEIVYDLHNHAQMRFIEPLLYNKHYHNDEQFLVMQKIFDDKRSFCLSTPFLPSDDTLKLKVSFNQSILDELFKMKYVADDPTKFIERLSLSEQDAQQFLSFFTSEPNDVKEDANYSGDGIRVRYLGHACVLLQTSGLNILVDPCLGYNYEKNQTDRFSFMDIPDVIDYVLITHNHQDHFLFETLLQLRHKIKNIVVPASNYGSLQDPCMKMILRQLGFKNIIATTEFEGIALEAVGEILTLPFLGEHADLNIQTKQSYFIRLKNKKILFLADSNNLDPVLYDNIVNITGPVDTLFIGMECVGAPASWLYGPVFSIPLVRSADQSRRLSGSNFTKAFDIVRRFQAKQVNIYAMGMEPWLNYIMAVDYKPHSLPMVESDKLVQACQEEKIACERLYGKREWVYD
jgi:L-ascorbate metabolism protein UlaG (beta-lactamase superfamily)